MKHLEGGASFHDSSKNKYLMSLNCKLLNFYNASRKW
jgi:hypothetical protein